MGDPTPQSPTLSGKVALVTGGGRGIGRAVASRFAGAGATVVIASRNLETLNATAEAVNGLGFAGRLVAMACHVGRADEVEALVSRVESELGPVDILVNNAATNVGQGPSLDLTDSQFDKVMEVNVKSALRLVQRVVPGMLGRGRGVVLNVASVAGLQPMAGGLAYSASKAALIMMTRSWAREFGPGGVRVNAIAPGLIQTDMSAYFWEDDARRESFLAAQSVRRLGRPDDVAGLALFLASDDAGFINGQVLVADGGMIG